MKFFTGLMYFGAGLGFCATCTALILKDWPSVLKQGCGFLTMLGLAVSFHSRTWS